MIPIDCQVDACRRTTQDGAPICTHCASGLAEQLRGVPGLLDDLLVAYSRQDRITSGGGGGSETPLPYREDLPEAVWELGNTLTTILRTVVEPGTWPVLRESEARPLSGRYGDHALYAAAVAALMLAERVHVLRRRPAALELVDELDHAIKRARARTDRRPPTVYRGPCSGCGEQMRAKPGATIIQCQCGQQHDGPKTRERLLAEAADQLLTAPELSVALAVLAETTVPVGRIRVWKARKMIEVRSWLHDGHTTLTQPHRDGDGNEQRCCRPLFRVGDATKLLGR